MKSNFIEECKAIVVESSFASRWAEIEGMWELGKRISEENISLKDIKRLAYEIEKDEETILKAILFFKRFPDLSYLPGGKAISWRGICEDYL